jgi:hypothetical protein
MSKTTFTLIIIIVIAALVGGGYWFYLKNTGTNVNLDTNPVANNNSTGTGNIFSPLAGNNVAQTTGTGTRPSNTTNSSTTPNTSITVSSVPTLRELSSTPVGGMSASTTGTTTIVRWIDRGTGYVYQASSNSLAITELSNTTVPMIYQSFWNRNLNAFIFQSVDDTTNEVTNFYTVLSTTATISTSASSTLSTNTPYQLRGEPLPSNITEIALNPEHTSVFTLALSGNSAENDNLATDNSGIGYISQFDGSKKTEIFSTPLTQVNVEWPADNIIALTTKGFSATPGFLYFVNPKTGTFTNILANVNGLDTLTNHDASQVLYSASGGTNGLTTSVYDVKAGTTQTLAFNTLPEKCLWSSINKDDLICAVPSRVPSASYPEAWYQGTVAFSDSIWEINITTGEVHELADLAKLSGKQIDAENLTLDPKENFLYFINKRDLTLWSLSLD